MMRFGLTGYLDYNSEFRKAQFHGFLKIESERYMFASAHCIDW